MTLNIQIDGIGIMTSLGSDVMDLVESIHGDIDALRTVDEMGWKGIDGTVYSGGFIEEHKLAPLHRKVRNVDPYSLYARLLRLSGSALKQLKPQINTEQLPILIIVVPKCSQFNIDSVEVFLDNIIRQAQLPLNIELSEVVVADASESLNVIKKVQYYLNKNSINQVIVGGVDSYLNFSRLWEADVGNRKNGIEFDDGFPHGEGAGFFLLSKQGNTDVNMKCLLAQKKFDTNYTELLPFFNSFYVENVQCRSTVTKAIYECVESEIKDITIFQPSNQFGYLGVAQSFLMIASAYTHINSDKESGACMALMSGVNATMNIVYIFRQEQLI